MSPVDEYKPACALQCEVQQISDYEEIARARSHATAFFKLLREAFANSADA